MARPSKQTVGNVVKTRPALAEGGSSWFGRQTAHTHGEALLSRSPTRFFHAAPGQFRDVDLKGCYAGVMANMSVYVGRPVPRPRAT